MHTLIRKIFYILLPVLAIFILIVSYVDNSSYDIYNDDLENKIIELTKLNSNFSLVLAGDSRAERQIMPAIIESRYNIKSINIATSSCDIVTMYNALKKYHLVDKSITVVVSAGFFQVNDGAIDTGYISMAQMINMPLKDKLRLFSNNLTGFYRKYSDALKVNITNQIKGIPGYLDKSDERLIHLGFKPIYGNLKLPVDLISNPKTTKHSWYKNINIHGTRWKVFQSTLKKMSESKCRFILYQAPVSDAFKDHVIGTSIDKYEQEFSSMLENESNKYSNISFIDYYSLPPKNLNNEDYYDPQHLNKNGAVKFTAFIIDDCINKSLLVTNR